MRHSGVSKGGSEAVIAEPGFFVGDRDFVEELIGEIALLEDQMSGVGQRTFKLILEVDFVRDYVGLVLSKSVLIVGVIENLVGCETRVHSSRKRVSLEDVVPSSEVVDVLDCAISYTKSLLILILCQCCIDLSEALDKSLV